MLEYGAAYFEANDKYLADYKCKCENAGYPEVYILAMHMAEELDWDDE